jgi:MFS family permease
MTLDSAPLSDSRQAFSYLRYRLYWGVILCTGFAVQIMSVSVSWQVYDLTREPLLLGLIGLAQFLPALLLVLVTGLVADRFSRRKIIAVCLGIELVCAGCFFAYANAEAHEVRPIFAVLVLLGIARAFANPANDSLVPNLVPPDALASAIALNASAWHLATITGPVAGGLLYGISAETAYGTAAALLCVGLGLIMLIPKPPQRSSDQQTTIDFLLGGFRYIWSEKIVFGAISLDLFAVLLGGAVALLPIFARDILEVGPWGLGLLRAAPGIGALTMAAWLARFPIKDRAGYILFGFVAAFGFFILIFGLSKWVWLSVPALVLAGACDMVSVSVRETLLQLWTPDVVRGRVSAVNRVFIGASNELGEFRAGLMAAWIGAVSAVAVGGVGTMAVAAIWARMFPQLREARSLDRRMV